MPRLSTVPSGVTFRTSVTWLRRASRLKRTAEAKLRRFSRGYFARPAKKFVNASSRSRSVCWSGSRGRAASQAYSLLGSKSSEGLGKRREGQVFLPLGPRLLLQPQRPVPDEPLRTEQPRKHLNLRLRRIRAHLVSALARARDEPALAAAPAPPLLGGLIREKQH